MATAQFAGLGEPCDPTPCGPGLACFMDVPGGECSEPCVSDGDCPQGAVCAGGYCHVGCASSSDCARVGFDCSGGGGHYCAPAVLDGGSDDRRPELEMRDLTTSDLATPDLATPDLATPDLATPDLALPDLTAPDLATVDLAIPDLAMPDLAIGDLSAPDLTPLPDLVSPGDAGGCVAANGRVLLTLVSGQPGPFQLKIDANNVYWLADDVMSVPIGGGAPQTIAAKQLPHALAIDANNIYWLRLHSQFDTTIVDVYMAPLGGGNLMTLIGNQKAAWRIAVDATTLYWTLGDLSGAVVSMPINDPFATQTLASTQNYYPGSLAVDETNVYWSPGDDPNFESVKSTPKQGGATTTLAVGEPANNIVVDAKNVYWTTNGYDNNNPNGTVMSVPKGGGMATTLASGQKNGQAIAVDASYVYWSTGGWAQDDATIMKIPIGGGNAETLACGHHAYDLAVDATSLYWVDNVAGTVEKLTPK